MADNPATQSEISTVGNNRSESQSAETNSNNPTEPARREEVYRVLADHRRRYVLHHLNASTVPLALADVADELVRWETDKKPIEVQEKREQMYSSLYHCHIPKLADANLVSFDVAQKRVSLCESNETKILD